MPQEKSVVYDCILDQNKTVSTPPIELDVLDRYRSAYNKLLEGKPNAFHKVKLGFSDFINISKSERELSNSKSPRKEV